VLVIYSTAEQFPKPPRGASDISQRPVKHLRDRRRKGLHVCQQILSGAHTVFQDRLRELLGQKELISDDIGVQITGGWLRMSRLDL
jgi:hypothetical protein